MFNQEHARPIEAENIEKHEEELDKRLQAIQLSFADRKFSEEKKLNPELNFSGTVSKYTSIKKHAELTYQTFHAGSKEGFENFWLPIAEEINKIYEEKTDDWQEKVADLMVDKIKSLGLVIADHSAEKENRTGIIKYNLDKGTQDFEKFGIGTLEPYVEIHFDEAYRQKGDARSLNLKKSLEELARKIVEKHPEAKYIVGRSWILDHKIADRMGFKIVEKTDSLDHFSTWWQLMDKNGQIDQRRLERFAKEGKLHFQVALGIIAVEDFLNRYLPDEMRGKVKLKEMKKEDSENLALYYAKADEFRKSFGQMSKAEISEYFKNIPYLGEHFETGEVRDLISLLCEIKDKGLDPVNPGEDYAERMKRIRESIDKFLPKLSEKEIFIEPRK